MTLSSSSPDLRPVLALISTSENDALLGGTMGWFHVFGAQGVYTDIVRLQGPEIPAATLKALEAGQYRCGFAIQGIGSGLKAPDGRNLWTATRTPFVGLHFDHPSHNPYNHFSESPYVGYIYAFQSFLETKRKYLSPFPQVTKLGCHAFGKMPEGEGMPLRDRPIRLLFLKTGNDMSWTREVFAALPQQLRDAVFDQMEVMRKNPNLLVADLVNDVFRSLGVDRLQFEIQFWDIVRAVDLHVRYERAALFVDWLKRQEGAVIVGRGWDFIDKTKARATFRDAVPIDQTDAWYKMTQFVCNTSPYGSDIVHERVMSGLAMGCCVITDTNAWWDEHAGDVPSLLRFSWDKPLDDQIPAMMQDPVRIDAAVKGREVAMRLFAQSHTPDILGFAEEVRAFAEEKTKG